MKTFTSTLRPFVIILGVVFALTSFASAATPANEPSQRPRTNIVLILADDLGYGDLSVYGQKTYSTPSIDELAADGMRFTRHYAGSTVCAPSRCVLMTGLHTGHAPLRTNWDEPMADTMPTLARSLQSAG